MWTQVEANPEARAGIGEVRSVQAAETNPSTVWVFGVKGRGGAGDLGA